MKKIIFILCLLAFTSCTSHRPDSSPTQTNKPHHDVRDISFKMNIDADIDKESLTPF